MKILSKEILEALNVSMAEVVASMEHLIGVQAQGRAEGELDPAEAEAEESTADESVDITDSVALLRHKLEAIEDRIGLLSATHCPR